MSMNFSRNKPPGSGKFRTSRTSAMFELYTVIAKSVWSLKLVA